MYKVAGNSVMQIAYRRFISRSSLASCAILLAIAFVGSSVRQSLRAQISCPNPPCYNPIPCPNCNGSWVDDVSAVWTLDTDHQQGPNSITGFLDVPARPPDCPAGRYSVVTGTLTTIPGSGGLPGRTTFVITAQSPPPNTPPCVWAQWIQYSGEIFNNGCNTGNGSFTNSFNDSGFFWWSRACDVPSRDDSFTSGSWADDTGMPTMHYWVGQVVADRDFGGRQVFEAEGGPGVDHCHFFGSDFAPFVTITGGGWPVGSLFYNGYGYDRVGWNPAAVTYYRNERPARGLPLPCSQTMNQAMRIMCNTGTPQTYWGNALTNTIGSTTVSSKRGNAPEVTRQW